MVNLDVVSPPFDDERVRQALALAIDKQALVQNTLRGQQPPALGGLVPPGVPGHAPDIGLPCDRERARALLAAAGYPGGAGFPPVHAMIGANRDALAAELSAQWRAALGVEIGWEPIQTTNYVAQVIERRPQLFILTWTADHRDPDNFLRVALSVASRWRDPGYQALIDQARATVDQQERLAIVRRADQLLMTAAPIIPLCYFRQHMLVKPWLVRRGEAWKHWELLPRGEAAG